MPRLRCLFVVAAWLCCSLFAHAQAAEPGVAIVIPRAMAERLDVECDMACEAAERLMAATVLLSDAGGRFVDRRGQEVALERFGAVWCHYGNTVPPKNLGFDPQAIAALRQFVARGRGLWLSGAAATMIGPLGLDTLGVQPVRTEQDCAQAGLIPDVPQHPVFQGVDLDRGALWLSNAVYPAFTEFRLTRNPAQGQILAHAPGNRNCPLVEYQAGDGRVIALGWQFDPLYVHAPDGPRHRFEQLVVNLLRYLRDPRAWTPLMPRSGGSLGTASGNEVSPAQWRALGLALRDLRDSFGPKYPRGEEFFGQLNALKGRQDEIAKRRGAQPDSVLAEEAEIRRQFERLKAESLLANPLIDFTRLLAVQRDVQHLGLPANYLGNCSLPPTGYDNQIVVLSPVRADGMRTTLYRPPHGEFVGDVRLDYDAQRLMFSMPNAAGRWRIHEMNADGSGLRELPLVDEPDVDNYDACYLPDGRIVFSSTACFAGIPCVNGEGHVANLYLRERSGKIRQLTVEQDHDWCPTVLNNGRLLYLRWEYTDLPHAFSRILFHMNPDGTEQMEYYGSNSYWPTAMFFARPIPNHPTKVVAIVSGHHELPRTGDLVLFDPARGRHEAQGAVQRIPGFGRKVEPAILDLPIVHSWPKFLHPYPLSDKHFLVSCKPAENALWGIYLVDVFDNAVLLAEEPGYAMFEPVPLRATPRPPCIPDKVDLSHPDAEVLIADIYRGEGLAGVPPGSIKSLRVIGYHFAYEGMGAEPYAVGLDGPWDPKRVLGTVPVEADGSARFRVPANTPFALQPLDAEGKAVQLMRSWITAMPGEVVACVGCHEPQNTAPPVRRSLAALRPPVELQPWYGPARGFSFRREVQPVLDRHCTRCHNGEPRSDGKRLCSFRDGQNLPVRPNPNRHNQEARFSPSYYHLRQFVRTPCKESDMHLLRPWEYHADTTRLVQLLRQGHYDVTLDAQAWDRLFTWIDLNAPFHGDWDDIRGDQIGERVRHQSQRRAAMRKAYAGTDGAREETGIALRYQGSPARTRAEPGASIVPGETAGPKHGPPPAHNLAWPAPAAWPASVAVPPPENSLVIALSPRIQLELVRIPAGEFMMGQEDGAADERPAGRVKIGKPFWMGRFEVTNEQFALFDPGHDSRWENNDFIKFGPGELGWTLARPKQPVVRVAWTEATAFCRWLTQKTGRPFALPTETQWEYACRAGTTTPLSYGTLDDDFSRAANVSDLSHHTIETFDDPNRPDVIPPWRPADARFDDHSRVSAPVGSYRPNPWGLFDMHGNVAEWTCSEYRAYPYRDDGRDERSGVRRVVRGGSWYDRPVRCRSAARQVYLADQPVYDVGFRVVCE